MQLNLREPLLSEFYESSRAPWYRGSFKKFVIFLIAASLLAVIITLPIGFSKNCDLDDDKCNQDARNIIQIPLLVFVGVSVFTICTLPFTFDRPS
jgi:hypothetical protein